MVHPDREGELGRRVGEKFDRYLCGLEQFKLVTDHKPLVPLINSHSLDNIPLRCQRLLMRLMRFSPVAEYAPGKTFIIADTLSRSPLPTTGAESDSHSMLCRKRRGGNPCEHQQIGGNQGADCIRSQSAVGQKVHTHRVARTHKQSARKHERTCSSEVRTVRA